MLILIIYDKTMGWGAVVLKPSPNSNWFGPGNAKGSATTMAAVNALNEEEPEKYTTRTSHVYL